MHFALDKPNRSTIFLANPVFVKQNLLDALSHLISNPKQVLASLKSFMLSFILS